jgi:regulator of replication initiation timing
MKTVIIFASILLASSFASGQVSVEEAKARLAARQAHAATQPAESLSEEVVRLRAENAALRARLAVVVAELEKQKTPAKTAEKPDPKKIGQIADQVWMHLKVGMTEDEAEAIRVSEKRFTLWNKTESVTANGKTVSWSVEGDGGSSTKCRITFVDGKISYISF